MLNPVLERKVPQALCVNSQDGRETRSCPHNFLLFTRFCFTQRNTTCRGAGQDVALEPVCPHVSLFSLPPITIIIIAAIHLHLIRPAQRTSHSSCRLHRRRATAARTVDCGHALVAVTSKAGMDIAKGALRFLRWKRRAGPRRRRGLNNEKSGVNPHHPLQPEFCNSWRLTHS